MAFIVLSVVEKEASIKRLDLMKTAIQYFWLWNWFVMIAMKVLKLQSQTQSL